MSEGAAGAEERVYPYFTFDIPPNFHELPLAAAPEDREEQLRAFVDEVQKSQGSTEQRQAAVGMLADLMDQLADQDVVHASFATAAVEDHPSAASLTVAVHSLDYGDPHVAVDGIAAIQAARDLEGREVQTLRLPCGPAASVVAEHRLPVPAEASPTGEDVAVEVGQFQVYVPVPGQRSMLVLTLDTPSLPDWEVYAHVMGGIVNSLSFTQPPGIQVEERGT